MTFEEGSNSDMDSRYDEARVATRPVEPQGEPLAARPSGHRLLILRAASLAVASLAVVLFVVAIPVSYGQMVAFSSLPEGIAPAVPRANLAEAGISPAFYAAFRLVMEIAFAMVCLALAVVIFWRRSDEPMALFVSFLLVLLGITFWSTLQTFAATYPAWATVVDALDSLSNASLFVFFYLFPDGRFVPRWTRWLAVMVLTFAVLTALFPASSLSPDNYPIPVFILFMLGLLLTGVFAQIYRYRRRSGLVERQQAKWVVFGFAAAIGGLLGVIFFGEVVFSLAEPGTVSEMIGSTAITLFMLLIPLSIGMAILRYRLFDIDILVNRTLVYGSLTACVVGLYVLVVGYLGALFRVEDNLLVSLAATGVVAVVFAPMRARLQRAVNRLMYGERDDPYAVLSRLGERLGATPAPNATLSTVVETISGALKLPYAGIALRQGGGSIPAAEHGTPTGESIVLPLTHQGEPVGQLILAPRAPGEAFSSRDKKLLEDLARQAGAALHAVRLAAELQRSRERLVTAREEERRRLRRDLHDGLGPRLAAQTLKAGSARMLYARDPAAADALISELETDMESAIAEVRRLVYDLRPPALDELGLVGAVREAAAQYETKGLRISVEAPEKLPDLPAAVEVAAYRIVTEALTNVVRHAQATRCDLRLSPVGGALELEVSDDGVGFPAERPTGMGLHSMRERAEELGGECRIEPSSTGGVCVLARLPLPDDGLAEGE